MRPRITFANVVSVIALFVALGGTAIATHPGGQNTISTADIIDGQVKVADVDQGAVATEEIANGQVKNADIGAGEVRSSNVVNDNLTGGDIAGNSLKGADVDEATLDIGDAARAYARVSGNFACTGTPGTCNPDQSKGISSVTREGIGRYCVIAPGINAHLTPAAVTVDFSSTAGPAGNASAMTQEGADCGPEGFGVKTEFQRMVSVDSGGGTNNRTVSAPADANDNVGFTIVIP
jgi:hypothetical protein